MIKAQELRIGNYVKLNNPEYWPQKQGNIMMVTGLDPKRHNENFDWSVSMLDIYNLPFKVSDLWVFAGSIDEISQYTKYIEPIQITEEWLIKLGFKKDSIQHRDNTLTENVYKKGNYYIEFSIPEKIPMLCSNIGGHIAYIADEKN